MAQISIRERFHPFSHTPGVKVLLPGTSLCLQVYPTSVTYWDLEGKNNGKIDLPLAGPVSQFTVVQDLEQGAILIFGKDKNGFFRFRCSRDFTFKQEKGGDFNLSLFQPTVVFNTPTPAERLSIVSLQKRSIERLAESGDWLQLLAPLYRLMMWYDPLDLPMEEPLQTYLLGGFEGLLVPTGKDVKKAGYSFSFESPIQFLRGLRSKITSFFVEQTGQELLLCPNIPHEMPAGRIKGLKSGDLSLDVEWRKGILRRLSLISSKEKSLKISVKGHSSVRIERKKVSLLTPIAVQANQLLFFDRFEKN